MAEELKFVKEIRIAQFWRRELGDDGYNQRDPDDLVRWFDALELRGPDEIRAYLKERGSRYPDWPVTGIVERAPHPTRAIVEMWLGTHDKARTGPFVWAFGTFMMCCMFLVTSMVGCQNVRSWNPQYAWLPQPATLMPGTNSGPPAALATMPIQAPPPPINIASPSATAIAAQNGSAPPQSAPLGAEIGTMTAVQSAASSSVSSSSLTSATSASSSTGMAGAGAHAASASQSGSSQLQ